MHAEEKMRVAHQEDIQRHEEMAMSLLTRMKEMVQEDQGATLRVEELERQRDMLRNAVEHVNQVHQGSLADHFRGIERIEEASQAQHLRDEDLAKSLHQELGQIRSDAAQSFANIEQNGSGSGSVRGGGAIIYNNSSSSRRGGSGRGRGSRRLSSSGVVVVIAVVVVVVVVVGGGAIIAVVLVVAVTVGVGVVVVLVVVG